MHPAAVHITSLYLPLYGSLKPKKASLNIPEQKMDQFSTPISSVYLLFPIHHTVLTTTQSNILTFDFKFEVI